MQEIAVATNNSRSSYIHSILTTKKNWKSMKIFCIKCLPNERKKHPVFLKKKYWKLCCPKLRSTTKKKRRNRRNLQFSNLFSININTTLLEVESKKGSSSILIELVNMSHFPCNARNCETLNGFSITLTDFSVSLAHKIAISWIPFKFCT